MRSPKHYRNQWPDGTTTATRVGTHMLFVRMAQDDNPTNPLMDYDETGELFGFGRGSYGRTIDNVERATHELNTNPDAVPLDLHYDRWQVATDSRGTDGVWIPCDGLCGYADAEGKAVGSPARRTRMQEYAAQACESYNQFVHGEVYGYEVRLYKARKAGGHVYDERSDYRFDTPVYEDSCWGFFGDEYFLQEVDAVIADALKAARRRKAA